LAKTFAIDDLAAFGREIVMGGVCSAMGYRCHPQPPTLSLYTLAPHFLSTLSLCLSPHSQNVPSGRPEQSAMRKSVNQKQLKLQKAADAMAIGQELG